MSEERSREMVDEVLKIKLPSTLIGSEAICDDAVPASDENLVQAVLAGDETAYELIFERHKRPITRLVSRFFRERADIEECVQQCFTKAYFSLKNCRGSGTSLKSWLARIAVNVCYDEFRRRQRKSENLFAEMSDDENDYVESLVDRKAVPTDSWLIASQLVEKLTAGLDAKDKVALRLVYSEEYSVEEAASVIGISSSSLKSRLFRCRNHIKRRFGHILK